MCTCICIRIPICICICIYNRLKAPKENPSPPVGHAGNGQSKVPAGKKKMHEACPLDESGFSQSRFLLAEVTEVTEITEVTEVVEPFGCFNAGIEHA